MFAVSGEEDGGVGGEERKKVMAQRAETDGCGQKQAA